MSAGSAHAAASRCNRITRTRTFHRVVNDVNGRVDNRDSLLSNVAAFRVACDLLLIQFSTFYFSSSPPFNANRRSCRHPLQRHRNITLNSGPIGREDPSIIYRPGRGIQACLADAEKSPMDSIRSSGVVRCRRCSRSISRMHLPAWSPGQTELRTIHTRPAARDGFVLIN